MNIIIVESPGKIKKIEKIMGSNYKVISSVGHIRGIEPSNLGINITANFEPEYIILPDKKKVVSNIKSIIKSIDKNNIYIASDLDREGEAIAWHIAVVCNLPISTTKRIVFDKITKKEITEAIANPKLINMNDVNSQQARAVLDKLIGYMISPLLHKQFNNWKLSAGRVQSPVIKLVIERVEELKKFKSSNYFNVVAQFKSSHNNIHINTTLENEITNKQVLISDLIDKLDDAEFYVVTKPSTKKSQRKPPPPFESATLQQEAYNKLGLSPNVCMSLAQVLYENGYITYMRTDSITLADEALNEAEEYICSKYGEEFHKPTQYKTKAKNAQEAHEAIRPTNIATETVKIENKITNAHRRLYNLIWKRTIASQMTPASVETTTLKIGMKSSDYVFIGKWEKIIFDGYLILYKTATATADIQENDDNETTATTDKNMLNDKVETFLSTVKKNDNVDIITLEANEKNTKPSISNYTEATLIAEIKKLGIGRPSTYASMVSKVQDKGYISKQNIEPVEKEFYTVKYKYPSQIDENIKKMKVDGEKNKLLPTPTGYMINEYLNKHFDCIINYTFTAEVENMLDEILNSKRKWFEVVKIVYDMFNPIIENILPTLNKTNQKFNKNIIELGTHPIHKVPVIALNTRYGAAVCISYGDKAKNIYSNFNGCIEDMTFENALKLLEYPRNVGFYNDKEIILHKKIKFYIMYDDKKYYIDNYNSKNTQKIDPENITVEDAIKIIETLKRNIDGVKLSDDIKILNGPHSLYIKYKDKQNIPIPYKMRNENLTLKDAMIIIDNYLSKPKPKPKPKTTGSKPRAKPKRKTEKK